MGGTFELREIREHRTVKGEGFHYLCVWTAPHEPTWEPECNVKKTADRALSMYWLSATKSSKPDEKVKPQTPLKQQILSTKRVQVPADR